jgi:hypothetical protein
MKVWVVSGHSESGDHYIALFEAKPTHKHLSAIAHGWDGDEAHEGPGYDGSYVQITVAQHEVQ